MALSIEIDKDSVGLEKQNGVTRFHALVTVKDGLTVVAKKLIQGCDDDADLKAKCEALLESYEGVTVEPMPAPKTDDETIADIKASIKSTTVTAKAVAEIG